MRGFYLRAPFPVIARLDATIAYLADALADFGDTTRWTSAGSRRC